MTKLLKQKSKIGRDTKPRKAYDADLPQPRPRDPPPDDRHEEQKRPGEGDPNAAQGQPNYQNQQNDNAQLITNLFQQMAQDGDQRVEIGNNSQPPRVGRIMTPNGDDKMSDS